MNSFDRFRASVSEFVVSALHLLGFIEPKDSENSSRTPESDALFNSLMNKLVGLFALAIVKVALISIAIGAFP
jgi:hypothetical protein